MDGSWKEGGLMEKVRSERGGRRTEDRERGDVMRNVGLRILTKQGWDGGWIEGWREGRSNTGHRATESD